MNQSSRKRAWRMRAGALSAALALTGYSAATWAQANDPASPPPPPASASAASAAAPAKDIVLDSTGGKPPVGTTNVTNAAAPNVRLVPTPGAQPTTAAQTASARRYTGGAHDTATAGALAELGLDLMRQQSAASGNAQVNAVVSPLSLVNALAMVHAGTAGASSRELAALLGTPAVGERVYTARLPSLLDRLAKPGPTASPFVMANRVWVGDSVLSAVPASYAAGVADRFNADAAVLDFSQATAARQAINSWVSKKTAKRIPTLMPEGSITPSTKLVVTNAIHFKSKWAEPFDVRKTQMLPFQGLPGAAAKPVATMVDERSVSQATVDNISVLELPFAGNEFSLMVAMPPVGHNLNALEVDLEGLDIASWSSQLKPKTCRLQLPKFSIAPASQPLKASLEALGVKTVFGPEADFSPMLGKASKGVFLDNVFHSATIIIDEQGGEAAAATGAAVMAKSFSMPAPACAVDRPFVFAVIHKASGTPLFVGKVADPSQH